MLHPLLQQMFKMLSLCTAWRYRLRDTAAVVLSKHARTHACTHTHTQPFYGSLDFVPEGTFTHSLNGKVP